MTKRALFGAITAWVVVATTGAGCDSDRGEAATGMGCADGAHEVGGGMTRADGGASAPALDELALAIADDVCARCGPWGDVQPTDCRTEVTRIVEDGVLARRRIQIESGRLRYRGDLARECLLGRSLPACSTERHTLEEVGALRQSLDETFLGYGRGCDGVFEGTVPPGDVCDGFRECAGDARCLRTESGSSGTCTSPAGVGEPCGACAPGLYCRPSDTTCQPFADAASPCSFFVAGPWCADGLYCSGLPGMCTPPSAAGAHCSGSAMGAFPPCAVGVDCVGETAAAPGTCQPRVVVGAGEACDRDGDPSEGGGPGHQCCEGLSCVIAGPATAAVTLVCKPASPAGGRCRFGWPDPCPFDEVCLVSDGSWDGRCVALPRDGEPCLHFGGKTRRCAVGHVCRSWGGGDDACAALQRVGAPCTLGSECYSGSCEGGLCAVPSGL